MKYLSTLFVFFLILSQNAVFSQNDINNYKYVSVPDRFDFLKSTDQYQVNSLTKFLLEKNGFLVLDTSSNYPSDLVNNRCLLLNVNVEKIKGFLNTKLEVQFRNCKNELVFKSAIGTSKLKDFKKGYHAALRAAFESVAELNYSYKTPISAKANDKNPVPTPVEVITPPAPPKVSTTSSVPSVPPTPDVVTKYISKVKITPTDYGFKVIDESTATILHTLHVTIYDGVFLIDNLPGIAYKRGNRWVREFVVNQKIVIEPLLK